MLLRVSSKSVDLSVYRSKQNHKKLDTYFNIEAEEVLCPLCQGVLQFCDNQDQVDQIIKQVEADNYEANDFKISFTVSIVAALKKFKFKCMAEDKLRTQVPIFEADKSKTTSIDFKEVYKWILSPLIASRLHKPANLHSTFHI